MRKLALPVELETLFIVAEESAESAGGYLQTKLRNADVCYLGGHFMFWEFPDEFNAALETYLYKLWKERQIDLSGEHHPAKAGPLMRGVRRKTSFDSQ